MEAELFIQYYGYEDDEFEIDNDFYKNGEYEKVVSNEYAKSKDDVFNSMTTYKFKSSNVSSSPWEQYGITSKSSGEERVVYSSSKCVLYSENGEDENVDGIIDKFVAQKPFVEMIELDLDSSEEDFIYEFSMWIREHNKINEYASKNGEDWGWKNEPIRDLRISFINKATEKVFAKLSNCRIMDIVDEKTLIVFIEKLDLIDGI